MLQKQTQLPSVDSAEILPGRVGTTSVEIDEVKD